MSRSFSNSYDAVFLGGGLASSMCARYLKRKHEHLRILILEKNTTTRWHPGESTVGVTGIFMIRDLGLSTYAYVHQLPKNALRYFFHDSSQPFDPTRCSEIGCNMLPVIPTFQIDRARLDADLWELNQAIGIDVGTGCEVTDVRITPGEAPHEISFRHEDQAHEVRARWLIHGAGRNPRFGALFDELSPLNPDPDHNTAAAWGRFSNVGDIDLLGDEAWRERVGFTSRYLSTNHFMGDGYWIWAIPIGQDIVSWGVVYDRDVIPVDLADRQSFLDFLLSRDFPRALLAGAEMLDFQSHPRLAFSREKFCSEDGWAVVGDGYAFTDPFYSPGSDNIARHAYLLDHLISESDAGQLQRRAELLNRYCRVAFEQQRLLYIGQYGGFGSYELFNIKSLWDFFAYTNLLVRSFLEKRYADLDWIEGQVELHDSTIALMRAIQRGFSELADHLKSTETYERRNRDEYSLRQNRFRIEEEMLAGTVEDAPRLHMWLCRIVISEMLESRFGMRGFLDNKFAQEALSVKAMTSFELSDAWLDELLRGLSRGFEALLRANLGEEVAVHLTRDCFGAAVPRSLQEAHPLVASRAAQLWQQPAVNPVRDSLL